ncbi:outer membrane lipoprotein-sorting protein, partial [Vibrio sinaloensis]
MDVGSMVRNADSFRQGYESAKVVSEVALYENDTLDKTREYHVYTRENRESLVVFKSQVEQGQKMLMLGDNYWFVMPKSRRPIRITPMQKLLGEASVGDISTLTWSEDYHATFVSQD